MNSPKNVFAHANQSLEIKVALFTATDSWIKSLALLAATISIWIHFSTSFGSWEDIPYIILDIGQYISYPEWGLPTPSKIIPFGNISYVSFDLIKLFPLK